MSGSNPQAPKPRMMTTKSLWRSQRPALTQATSALTGARHNNSPCCPNLFLGSISDNEKVRRNSALSIAYQTQSTSNPTTQPQYNAFRRQLQRPKQVPPQGAAPKGAKAACLCRNPQERARNCDFKCFIPNFRTRCKVELEEGEEGGEGESSCVEESDGEGDGEAWGEGDDWYVLDGMRDAASLDRGAEKQEMLEVEGRVSV